MQTLTSKLVSFCFTVLLLTLNKQALSIAAIQFWFRDEFSNSPFQIKALL